MAKNQFDNEMEGQVTISDLFGAEEKLFAVSRIFSRARKEMSLAEQKTFVYALSQLRFTEKAATNYVRLDKKKLAGIVGIHTDANHLSVDLHNAIKELPRHSYIEIAERDLDLYASGFIITNVVSFKNIVRIKFEEDYIGLFTDLSKDYITMWSGDIFQMTSKRSVQFYEYLRQITDTRDGVNSVGLGIKALKDMFGIPKDGKGSYMREKGGFDRTNFERYVIEPICEDLLKCKMITLVIQQDGKPYEKVKRGNRVDGYRFYWTYSARPAVASAPEVKQIQERVDTNPQLLKVAKDIIKGKQKKRSGIIKPNAFSEFEHRTYDMDALEQALQRKLY